MKGTGTMNKRTVLFFGVLVLAMLACKAGNSPPAPPLVENAVTHSSMEQVEPERAEPVSNTRECHVRTRVSGGVLNLRSCAGTACSVIGYLNEGEPLTVLERGAWLKVETVTSEQGYVNSKFCRMEKIK